MMDQPSIHQIIASLASEVPEEREAAADALDTLPRNFQKWAAL